MTYLSICLVLTSASNTVNASCVKTLAQNEYIDCKGQNQITNSTCVTSHSFVEFKNEFYSCYDVTFKLTVSSAKYSKMLLTVVNLDASDNSLRIDDNGDFSLKHVGNKTVKVDQNHISLTLKSSHHYGVTQFDPRANFIMHWRPVLQTTCPAECDHCCDETNFKCYRKHQVCDGEWQCPNGQDERACPTCQSQPTFVQCPGDLVFDAQLKCLPVNFVCDGVPDCNCKTKSCRLSNGFEEQNCGACGEGAFHCASTDSCIPERQQCDMRPDCAGGEDELDCPIEDKRKVLTAAIVGSLGCGVLFVIALGCTRRLFHVQTATSCSSRARRNLQSLANILQVREAPPTYEVAMGIENQVSFGTRQSRSRPWRLTRNGLRRDSRRARRRHRQEENLATAHANGEVRVTEQPIASTESLDSFDSLPQPLVEVASTTMARGGGASNEGTDFGGARVESNTVNEDSSAANANETSDDKTE